MTSFVFDKERIRINQAADHYTDFMAGQKRDYPSSLATMDWINCHGHELWAFISPLEIARIAEQVVAIEKPDWNDDGLQTLLNLMGEGERYTRLGHSEWLAERGKLFWSENRITPVALLKVVRLVTDRLIQVG